MRKEALAISKDATYTGEVVDGKRHGHGTWRNPTETYVGQWFEDKEHGAGRQSWQDGRSYEGEYVNGMFSGHGKMVWPVDDGLMIYEGQYKDDFKNGHGKFTWPSGSVYEGGWLHGRRHGRATFRARTGQQRQGFWHSDEFQGWTSEAEPKPDMATGPCSRQAVPSSKCKKPMPRTLEQVPATARPKRGRTSSEEYFTDPNCSDLPLAVQALAEQGQQSGFGFAELMLELEDVAMAAAKGTAQSDAADSEPEIPEEATPSGLKKSNSTDEWGALPYTVPFDPRDVPDPLGPNGTRLSPRGLGLQDPWQPTPGLQRKTVEDSQHASVAGPPPSPWRCISEELPTSEHVPHETHAATLLPPEASFEGGCQSEVIVALCRENECRFSPS